LGVQDDLSQVVVAALAATHVRPHAPQLAASLTSSLVSHPLVMLLSQSSQFFEHEEEQAPLTHAALVFGGVGHGSHPLAAQPVFALVVDTHFPAHSFCVALQPVVPPEAPLPPEAPVPPEAPDPEAPPVPLPLVPPSPPSVPPVAPAW
jgi:hypothetical protein